MPSPSLRTIKRLFAVSANRCAFPDCDTPLSEDTATVTGQICHIRAANKGGPRFDENQTDEARHAYDNLILMCPRHHIIVDTEVARYTNEVLEGFKRQHMVSGAVEITPQTSSIAQSMLKNYATVNVSNNTGQVAINSPGAVQINNITRSTRKANVTVAPTLGSIASDLSMRSYVDYLIKRYQDCQKADNSKEGAFKYIAIHNAIRREFGCKWEFVSTSRFDELVKYLQRRLDKTKLGRIRQASGSSIYHPFSEHPK